MAKIEDVVNPDTGELVVPDEMHPTNQVSMDTVISQLESVAGGQRMVYSSIVGDDFETRARIAMAVSNAAQVSDHVGETINLANFVLQATTMKDDDPKSETVGEDVPILRTILVTAEGDAYAAVSDGLFKVLQTFTSILGEPSTWPPKGVPMRLTLDRSRRGFNYLTLTLDWAAYTALYPAE